MRFLIVGHAPFLASDIIREAAKGKCIIALDGACDKLTEINVVPNIILGDFDSVSLKAAAYWGIHERFDDIRPDSEPYRGHHGVKIIPVKDQNLTEMMKAIQYCDEQHAVSIDIVCALGGRMDQTFSNCRVLRSAYKKDRPIFLHTDHETIFFAKDEPVEIRGNKGDYCGIFAFPSGAFSSKGLKYNGDNYPLDFGYSESVSNALNEP
ncbi:MAG: thiamine pyrophosphokinase, partial [Gammaproteobacteria bacterium]